MKANNGSGNIPERDEWETPKELFGKLNKQYHFNFDCCANDSNRKTHFYTGNFVSNKTLKNLLLGKPVCWMNPPFSKAKEMFEHFFKVVKYGVAIYRCDNLETDLWQRIIFPSCDWIFIPKGRIVYEGMNGSSSRFPSVLIGVGIDPPKYIKGIVLPNIIDNKLGGQ
jgi:hypothetical protein